jgi:SNF2 family DNA or RNA helicase
MPTPVSDTQIAEDDISDDFAYQKDDYKAQAFEQEVEEAKEEVVIPEVKRTPEPTSVIIGPGVSALAGAVHKMIAETNSGSQYRFRNSDYVFFLRHQGEYSPQGTRYIFATSAMTKLLPYKEFLSALQFNYDTILELLLQDYTDYLSGDSQWGDPNLDQNQESIRDNRTATFKGRDEKFRNIIHVPHLYQLRIESSLSTDIYRKLRDEGIVEKDTKSSKYGQPSTDQHFKTDNTNDLIMVSDMCLDMVISKLEQNQIDASSIKTTQSKEDNSESSSKIQFINYVNDLKGSYYKIAIPKAQRTISFLEEIKENGMLGKGIKVLDEKDSMYAIADGFRSKADEVISVIRKYYDTSELDSFMTHGSDNSLKYLQIGEAEHPDLQVAIICSEEDKEKFKEIAKFSFPASTPSTNLLHEGGEIINVMRYENRKTGATEVRGNYKDWDSFIEMLDQEDFDVSELDNKFNKMVDDGEIRATRLDGQLNGYNNSREALFKDLDNEIANGQKEKKDNTWQTVNKPIELFPVQKEGVEFLYGRNSAILGDDPGVGKTFQLISAMHLRTKENNGTALIVTLPAVVKQFKASIIQLLGKDVEKDILEISGPDQKIRPAKWIIMYYDRFGKGGKIDDTVNALQSLDIKVASLDEVHNVKNPNIKSSKNLRKVTKNIPYVWGASATIASNRPSDVRGQLLAVNHRIGNMRDSEFNESFDSGTTSEAKVKSAVLLSEWLTKSGVYIKRTKEDVRSDIPSLSVSDRSATVDQVQLNKNIAKRLMTYAKESPITMLSASRIEVAIAKSSQSAEYGMSFISQGEKVLLFSNFIPSAKAMFDDLQESIKQLNKIENTSYYATTYVSADKKDERFDNAEKFKTDPNCIALVISTSVGGTGVDFPNVSQVSIMNDFDWTPAKATQSEGRTHRITSEKEVHAYYMIAEGTMDRGLYEKVQMKREISAVIENLQSILKKSTDGNIKNKITKNLAILMDSQRKNEESLSAMKIKDLKRSLSDEQKEGSVRSNLNREERATIMKLVEAAEKKHLKLLEKNRKKFDEANSIGKWEKLA